jgi:hypothetical protein
LKPRQIAGIVLVAAACIGFLTVADDFAHTGELFAVLGVMLAGMALLVDGRWLARKLKVPRDLPLPWVAMGIGIGELAGAALDRVPAGVVCGAITGLLAAAILGLRRGSALI